MKFRIKTPYATKAWILIIVIPLCFLMIGFSFKAGHLRQKGNKVDWRENPDEALGYFLESLEIEPDNRKALRAAGRIYYFKKDYENAEKYLKKAIGIDPDYAAAWNNLMWVYYRMERYAEMIEAAQRAMDNRPRQATRGDHIYDVLGLGIAYYRSGDLARGEKELVAASKMKTRDESVYADIYYHLAQLYSLKGDMPEFEKYAEKYIDKLGDRLTACRLVGRFLYLQDKYDLAEKYLKKTVDMSEDYAKGWNNLGWVYLKMKKYDAMRFAFEKAMENTGPDDEWAAYNYIGLAEAQVNLGHIGPARKNLSLAEKWVRTPDEKKELDRVKTSYRQFDTSGSTEKKTESVTVEEKNTDRQPSAEIKITESQNQDMTPPEIVMSYDRGVNIVSANRALIKGVARDESPLEYIKINGVSVKFDDSGHFQKELFLRPGANTIAVKAMDRYFNESEKTFSIVNPAQPSPPAVEERRLALLIGNSDYKYGGVLKNPVNDVRAMDTALNNLDFKVILQTNVTQREMKRAIDQFGRQLRDYSVGLFYYAGHGVQVNGTNYLIPVDADLRFENDVEYDCIDVGRVLGKMETASNKTNIIILDACRDNPFERSWSRSSQGKGLAFMNAPTGTLIAYATSPGRTASDGFGQNSLYTSSILEYITAPNINILELFQKVRKAVITKSNGDQIPWESTSLMGNFYFKQ